MDKGGTRTLLVVACVLLLSTVSIPTTSTRHLSFFLRRTNTSLFRPEGHRLPYLARHIASYPSHVFVGRRPRPLPRLSCSRVLESFERLLSEDPSEGVSSLPSLPGSFFSRVVRIVSISRPSSSRFYLRCALFFAAGACLRRVLALGRERGDGRTCRAPQVGGPSFGGA